MVLRTQSGRDWSHSLWELMVVVLSGRTGSGLFLDYGSQMMVNRVPSSYCGVYGIKPSHGRISARPSASLTPGVSIPSANSITLTA